MDVLVQMKNNFENSEKMDNLKKRVTGENWKGEQRVVAQKYEDT